MLVGIETDINDHRKICKNLNSGHKCDREVFHKRSSCRIPEVNLHRKTPLEPTEAQYLILNALETLGLLESMIYDPDEGIYYVETSSPVLLVSILTQTGEIIPLSWRSEL